MRRQFSYVVGIIVVAIAGIVYTFVAGNEPLLGIDLQGGVSVVLQPKLEEGDPAPSDEVLEQAVEVIRNRVDGLGVREPEIIREGSTVLVQLPGVENQEKAIELVGQTAELRFRPVVETMGLDGLAVYQAALDIIREAADPANEVDEETLGFARVEVDRWELTPDASASEEAVLESTDSTSPDTRTTIWALARGSTSVSARPWRGWKFALRSRLSSGAFQRLLWQRRRSNGSLPGCGRPSPSPCEGLPPSGVACPASNPSVHAPPAATAVSWGA